MFLPGKNGLNLELKRRHDNQDYNEIYSAISEGEGKTTYQDKYMVTFKNTTTNQKINIAFYTEDDFYTYMYGGCRLKTLNSDKLEKNVIEGTNYSFYDFSYIKGLMTDDEAYDFYMYDDSVPCIEFEDKQETYGAYTIYSRNVIADRNDLGNNWSLILPEVYLYQYSSEQYKSGTGLESEHTVYNNEYVGAFRDIEGNIYSFTGNDTYKKYKHNETYENTYTSNFSCKSNKYLTLTKYFKAQTLNNISYNFTVKDNRGYTYYLYNPYAEEVEKPTSTQSIRIVAVEDDYGNRISYI